MSDIEGFNRASRGVGARAHGASNTLRDEDQAEKCTSPTPRREDAWNKLEPQLAALEQRVGNAAESAVGDEIKNAGSELKAGFDRLYKSLGKS